tara:strand:+ start:510 stop:704 length:195 start_codon:yes stop_codon:yes gene_type:complete
MDRIDQMQTDISEIKTFLIGGEFNDNGVNKRLQNLEKHQAKDKKFKWMIAGGVSVLSFLITFLK